jgi:hypothetical protein
VWEPSAPVTDPRDPDVAALVQHLHDTLCMREQFERRYRAVSPYARPAA